MLEKYGVPDDNSLRRYAPFFLTIFIFLIILSDLFLPAQTIVHWQMVALIVILVILPFLPLIKRISYGDFEAEIGERVEEAEETFEENLPIPSNVRTSDYLPDELPEKLYRVFEESHIAALALLRTELEIILNEIADEEGRNVPYGALVERLKSEGRLNSQTIAALEDVRELANLAVHEKGVTEGEALEILEVGIEALTRLYYYEQEDEPMQESTRN